MASLAAWLLLAIVSPLVLLAPGYLVLRFLRAREASAGVSKAPFETFAFAAALSLAIVVLVAFGLSQTVGLSRVSLLVTFALLLTGLGLLVRRRETDPQPRADPEREASRRSTPSEGTHGLGVPARHVPAILIGLTLAIVATGALIYDGSAPYSQAYYANASEVEPTTTVEPGQPMSWTIVVENHEQRPANYTIETVRIPQANGSEEQPPSVALDQARLGIEPGENATYEVGFSAPEAGLWKVQTNVHVEGKAEPLTMHRWIAANTS